MAADIVVAGLQDMREMLHRDVEKTSRNFEKATVDLDAAQASAVRSARQLQEWDDFMESVAIQPQASPVEF